MTTTTATTTVARAPNVGDKAPDLTLHTSGGNLWTLKEATKKGPVVVAFMPGAFTGTCTKEACNFTANWTQYEQLGAQVVGVTVDSKHAQNAWIARDNIKIPLLTDFERKANHAWGVTWDSPWGTTNKRATFVVDKTGTIQYANVQSVASDEPNYADIQKALTGLNK